MTDDFKKPEDKKETVDTRIFPVAPAPHIQDTSNSTRRMMLDVLIALIPIWGMAFYVFGKYAFLQTGICILSCLISEALFQKIRRKNISILDASAVVSGAILGFSLPWNSPWYVGVVASVMAIGIGKVVFGGLGQNIFNPAMVGRAFVMICFPVALGAGAYLAQGQEVSVLTQATPLTSAKQLGRITELWPLFIGNVNGSLGETSAFACLLGGIYLCIRRTASFEIPLSMIGSVIIFGWIVNIFQSGEVLTVLHHLFSGALFFGAFFIATDPVTSPLTPKGKFFFGAGLGFFIVLIRVFSGYPEGVMFAVLLMNAIVPLINRVTIPVPLGGKPKI